MLEHNKNCIEIGQKIVCCYKDALFFCLNDIRVKLPVWMGILSNWLGGIILLLLRESLVVVFVKLLGPRQHIV